MKHLALLAVLGLAACGVDGEPVKPKTTLKQTFGVSSGDGSFSKTSLSFQFGTDPNG